MPVREDGEEDRSAIRNAFYTIQVDYLRKREQKVEDPEHGENLFDYGYIGRYDTYRMDNSPTTVPVRPSSRTDSWTPWSPSARVR